MGPGRVSALSVCLLLSLSLGVMAVVAEDAPPASGPAPVTYDQAVSLDAGNVVDVKARDPQRVAQLKVGDVIHVTYTQALAVSVEPAAH